MMNENFDLVPAPAAVLDEFARVSERLQVEFDIDVGPETAIIDAYFDEHNLFRFPTISVPYTAEGFAAALAIASETDMPLPFVRNRFSPETDFKVVNGAGTAFCVPAYKLNVVSDTSEQCTRLYGESFTQRILSTLWAHELAHSIFHETPEVVVKAGDTKHPQAVYVLYPLSGMKDTVYSIDDNYLHVPMWAEEAFAVYVAGDVFRHSLPNGKGHITEFEAWGPGSFWLDEQYLARVEEYPDSPGNISGSIAGQTLEMLDIRAPGTIDAMFDIARGEVDGATFREDLKQKVGPELFKLMFTNQPYTTWTTTYASVRKLISGVVPDDIPLSLV